MLSRNARLLLTTSTLLGFTVFGGIYTVLLNLYLLRLGYGARFIGLINGVGLLSSGLFSVPVGIISERAGIRRMLIVSMILAGIGFVALPCAELAPAALRSVWLLATYFVGNLGITVWAVNACPFLTAATSEQGRSHAFSSSFGLAAVGAFTGSLVASFLPGAFAALLRNSLEEPAPYRYTLLFAGALLFTGIPLFAATDHANRELCQRTIKDKEKAPLALIITMSLVVLLSVIGEGAANTFFNVYLDTGLSVATSRIGTLSALARLLALPATMAMPLLAARAGKGKTILLGHIMKALCLLPMALLPHWLAVGGGYIGLTMLASFSRPAFIAFQQEGVRPRWRTMMAGATNMTAGLGFAAAAFGGGYLVTAVGYGGLFLVGAAVSLVGVLVFWAYFVAPGRCVTKEAAQTLKKDATIQQA
jgi:MFS family permease